MGRRLRRALRIPVITALALATLMLVSSVSSGQIRILPTPTPKPTTKPTPTLTPPPTETIKPTQPPLRTILPHSPSPTPKKTGGSPGPSGSPGATASPSDKLPDALEQQLLAAQASVPRTPGHNTVKLVHLLEPLTKLDLPLEDVLIEGMGQFPVAGLAYYSDDWLAPRFHPEPHLHKGLDIFADFGTPIRSPEKGVVSQFSDGGAGGIAVWTHARDGNSYYFAHMLQRADGLQPGDRVDVGTILGYVGDTGNAAGGAPHLHFEVHPGGGGPVPPKPYVDKWLEDAIAGAPAYVAARLAAANGKSSATSGPGITASGSKNDGVETSMMLALLDPVGGSVGILPSLELEPRRHGIVSDHLLQDLIDQRVAGSLFVPSRSSPQGD